MPASQRPILVKWYSPGGVSPRAMFRRSRNPNTNAIIAIGIVPTQVMHSTQAAIPRIRTVIP